MNRKISLLVLIACVVCVATFMFSFSPSDGELKLKKSHSFTATKNHEWGLNGYTSIDKNCQKKCSDAQGMSCGKPNKIVVKQVNVKRKIIGMELHWSVNIEFQLKAALNQSENEYNHFLIYKKQKLLYLFLMQLKLK